jgi:hypothetical protein
LEKYRDFEQFSLENIVRKMRENLDKDVYLRLHIINNFTFDDDVLESDADLMMREQEMEDGQSVKRNSYLNLLTQFTNMHPVPTHNIDLANIHEKNNRIRQRVEELQKTVKGFMMKNMKQNTKHGQETKALKEKIKE